MSAPRFLRVARALALGGGVASCASAVIPGAASDAAPIDSATSPPDAPPACDLDAAGARHFIRDEPPAEFATHCPAEIPSAATACERCVYCNYDTVPTGDCTCAGPGSHWSCQYRMAPWPPPELPLA